MSVLLLAATVWADVPVETPKEHNERMEWWREARFGMFIHWGVYSVPAGEWEGHNNFAEWIMEEGHIPVSRYEQFAKEFNPTKFDAKAFVKTAKDAGMKYIVITSKHHDGFCMWPSALTDWSIKSTPFQRDPLAELSSECRQQGIRFCVYYSIMDWHSSDWATRRAWNDKATGVPDMDSYEEYMKGQLKELVTLYHPGLIWFDGEWESPWTPERGERIYTFLRQLDPDLIINNRIGKSRAGMAGVDAGAGHVGDYATPEQQIPPAGFGPGVDWETCMTLNNHWGYNKHDDNWKSPETIIHNLCDIASKGGNYLLNVGPTSEGLIPQPSVDRLAEVGKWMKVNGDAIYGSSATPFGAEAGSYSATEKDKKGKPKFIPSWEWRATTRPGKIYVELFKWPSSGTFELPALLSKVKKVTLLAGGKDLPFTQSVSGVAISLPAEAPDQVASVIRVDIRDKAARVAPHVTASAEPVIIPEPKQVERLDGMFKLTSTARIYTDPASSDTGDFLASRLRTSTGYRLRLSGKTTPEVAAGINDGILLTTQGADASLGAEGYELTVDTGRVVIRAPGQAGLFYGVQTLLQLLPPEIFSSNVLEGADWEIPCVKVTDQPRFGWRGFMLDVSRHFYNKQEVEKLLDVMALHKLNTFHWHLVDDNGWRIEIKKYPKLTSVGAWRGGVGFGLPDNSTTAYGPDGRYGGFYTQDDIREVVAYAAKLHITIIPEIEMPGHSLAALSAYPEYGTGNGPFEVPLKGGVNPGIYSPANPETFEFLDNVLSEVFQLFPSKYVHVGGDEVPKGPWKADQACQDLMKREGLKNEEELQSWFIRHIEKYVNSQGKTLIGWSEILQGGLAQNAVVMDWIGGGREAASQGHDVVMTPTSNSYFDYYQSRDTAGEPRAIGGFLPLKKVYDFEPIPAGLAPEMQSHVLGAQGNVWTEYIPNLRHVEYMTFPRLSALAEVSWSPKDARNYDGFLHRLKADEKRLDELDVNYRSSALGDGTEILGEKVGGWTPAQIKTEAAPLEWDVTSKVTKAGKATVNFYYTSGAHGIDIAWAALVEDGLEVSRDGHAGFTGAAPRRPDYHFDVPAPKKGAHYVLRAQIAGSGGTDSHGNVLWNLKSTAAK